MMNGGADPVFVDTNVLVYAALPSAPDHAIARDALWSYEQSGARIWISRQVLREYLATLTRPQTYSSPIVPATLVADVVLFERKFAVAEDNDKVTQRLLDLLVQTKPGGKQVHDANIVATMLAYGIDQLLTHNTSDFSRFSDIITILPLQQNS